MQCDLITLSELLHKNRTPGVPKRRLQDIEIRNTLATRVFIRQDLAVPDSFRGKLLAVVFL
jgi:hypothetical protein